MPNRTEAAGRKPSQSPPRGYSHCACSRLYKCELTYEVTARAVGPTQIDADRGIV